MESPIDRWDFPSKPAWEISKDLGPQPHLPGRLLWTSREPTPAGSIEVWIIAAGCFCRTPIYWEIKHSHIISNKHKTGWWFQPLWKMLVSWDYYSQDMESHKSHVSNKHKINRTVLSGRGFPRFHGAVAALGLWDQLILVTYRVAAGLHRVVGEGIRHHVFWDHVAVDHHSLVAPNCQQLDEVRSTGLPFFLGS